MPPSELGNVGLICVGRDAGWPSQPDSLRWKSPLLLILFGMIALWLSYAAAFLIRLSIDDTFTVAVEVVVRNSHLGILLKAALFSSSDTQHLEIADGVLYTVLLYAGVCLLITISEVVAKRKMLGPVYGPTRKRTRLD